MTGLTLWAPTPRSVEVSLPGHVVPMEPDRGRPGWWRADVDVDAHGSDYAFVLDGGDPLPDPRSRRQPNGVHGPSRTYDHGRFEWHDSSWRGPHGCTVIYELHVGTFTDAGTFDAAIERLDHLVDLGVSHVELLPVATFDGPRGWGYDGVDLFAVHEPYGGPDGCKRFVDACHQRGLGVVFDVVYNHLGPSGNHLARFGPYFTDRYRTPWGDAVNLDGPGSDEVRRFLLDNARSWIEDFHADGLRLDATHELHDSRALPLIEALAALADDLSGRLARPVTLIAESDRNDPGLVTRRAAGGTGLPAQWNDDVHHSLHALLTGERQGYYVDFGPPSVLAKAWTDGFVHDGTYSTFRDRHHGRPVDPDLPPGRFVAFLQDHDQIGNRARGDRLAALVDRRRLEVGAALLLLGPNVPMLFMGEEWAAATPWPYFTSFPDPGLATAVRDGRRAEFAAHGWEADAVPDPQDPETFNAARLAWDDLDAEDHRNVLRWYRALIALRRDHPRLTERRPRPEAVHVDDDAGTITAHLADLGIAANLGADRQLARWPISWWGTDHETGTRASLSEGGHARPLLSNDPAASVTSEGVDLPAGSVAVVAAPHQPVPGAPPAR